MTERTALTRNATGSGLIIVPLRTVSGANAREHHMARARRVKIEREAVAWMLKTAQRPALPCVVTLTRVAPSSGLDLDDNLPGALKGVRDEVAKWLGVNDRRRDVVRYEYAQRRGVGKAGAWQVWIRFAPMTQDEAVAKE